MSTAFNINEGLVVASCGWYWLICLKSPVSATTVVNCLSASSWFMHPLSLGEIGFLMKSHLRFQATVHA